MVNLFRLPIIKAADRSTQFLANLKDYNPDAVLMNDVGLHWKNLPMVDSWAERTLTGFPPHKFRFSYNTHEDKQELVQWGGTGLLTLDQFRTRTYKQMGSDPHNLGWWTWARIQGRHNFFIRIVSAYRPCKNTSNLGSSYQQQLRYFRSRGEFRCPRELFDLQLQHQLQEWMAEGDHIIVGLDLNDDARTCPTTDMLRSLGI